MEMKRILRSSRLLLNGAKVLKAIRCQKAGAGIIKENAFHIEAGVRWLLRAQEVGGGGFSRKFCLYDGWDKPYVETTGYIIPTMIASGQYLKDPRVNDAGKRAAYWILGMQRENGAFCDIDTGQEQVFDTGQVLSGLITAFREWGDSSFLDAAVRAGRWLEHVQEKDGSWERYAFHRRKHAYYVKVAAALLALAQETGERRFHKAGIRNIQWTLDCQNNDGYFEHAQFRSGESPFLHTIVYILEGLLDAYTVIHDDRILQAVLRTYTGLSQINRDRDMILCSQYDRGWNPVNRERCLSGLAQWACITMRAQEVTSDEGLLDQATKTMYYLKSKQYLLLHEDLYGSLPGSVPLWGAYLGFCYPNWGVKYFIDALLAYEKYGVPSWREQEQWVSESFRFSDSLVSDDVGSHDETYTTFIEKEIDMERDLTILDIGCGKGKFIRYFREKYPRWKTSGIDPSFSEEGISTGSVYSLPVRDGYADVVMLIEVMQHVGHIERAVSELSRVTREGGYLVIGDRDPFSLIGLMKSFMEMAGMWMYPWDSPFREQWRSQGQWKDILGTRWEVISAHSFDDPDNRIPMSNRFYLIIARKKKS